MDQLDKLNLGPVKLGNPNTYDKAKLCLFLFMPALEIVSGEAEVF